MRRIAKELIKFFRDIYNVLTFICVVISQQMNEQESRFINIYMSNIEEYIGKLEAANNRQSSKGTSD